jgi:hypothetical protein
MDKTQKKIVMTACLSVIIVAILLYVTLDNNDETQNPINNGLTSLVEFDVDCPEAGTSTEGTFFVMESKDSVSIKIVADLIVGETDIYGVEFFVPVELDIVSVLCSFNDDISTKYVTIRDWPEGGHLVYVANARYSPAETPIGGHGTVVIDLQLSGNVRLSDIDSLDFQVTVANATVEDIAIMISH